MVTLVDLWLPILVSAAAVFVVSTIVHMVLPYHRGDWKEIPSEAEVMDALRRYSIPPGDYMVPCAGSPSAMNSPAFKEKRTRGPVFTATFIKSGPVSMGPQLAQWFIFCLVVSIFSAYVVGRAAGPGTEYLVVFRFSGTTAFIAYAVAQWGDTIWYRRSVMTTIKHTFDGLLYGCVTAAVFGALWPE